MRILKAEIDDSNNKLKQLQGTHEKEHLKKILVKFLENILKGEINPESFELLKILCSIVYCTEAEKNNMNGLLTKLQAKKKQGGFLNMF